MQEEHVVETGSSVVGRDFAQDIARYFKTFLETDLTGELQPLRQSTPKRLNGLMAQLYLDKYPQLNKNLYKNFGSGFTQETFVVSQNKYVTHSDERLSDLFARAIEGLGETQSVGLVASVARAFDKARLERTEHHDAFLAHALAAAKNVFSAELVVPILRSVQHSLAVADTDDNGLQLGIAATEKVYGSFEPALQATASQFYLEQQSVETLTSALQAAIDIDTIRLVLRSFLDEFNAADAYQELYQLHRNNQIFGQTEMLLYFCEIKIGDLTFPIFYTPVTSTHAYPSVTLEFENRVFVNTHALQYALQAYNRTMNFTQQFVEPIDQVLYIDSRNRKDLLPRLQAVVDIVASTFSVDKKLRLDSATEQAAGNLGVVLNNRLQVVIAPRSNDAIVQDYEEILRSNNAPSRAFTDLVSSYVLKQPMRFVQEVAEEWENKTLAEKLLSDNPLPLNDEQRQALLALNKKECDVVVVDGAPGTGKSHFVSSVVAQSFLDGYSVMVLSDTPAALDDVHAKVTDLLHDARLSDNFHNPMLRLGQIDNDFLDDIEQVFLQKLVAYHQKYSDLQGELRTAKTRKIQETSEVLNALQQNAENINLHEVEQTVNNESKFAARDWIQDEPIEAMNAEMQRLHQAIQYIRRSEANYLLPYIEASQQQAISEFIGIIREYEKASKNVNERLPEFIVRYRKLLPEQKSNLQASLSYVHSNYRQYVKILNDDPITANLSITDATNFRTLAVKQALANRLIDVAHGARTHLGTDKAQKTRILDELLSYKTAPEDVVAAVSNYIDQVNTLRSKIFGFSGRTLVVENLTRQLKKTIPEFGISEPEKKLEDLQIIVSLVEYITAQLAQLGLDLSYWKEVMHVLHSDEAHVKELQKIMTALVAPGELEFMGEYRIYEADNLLANISLLQYATELNDVFRANPNLATLFGIKTIGQVLAKPQAFSGRFNKLATDLDDVKQLDECKRTIKQFLRAYPAASKRLGVNYVNGNLDIIDDTFAESSTEEVKEYLAYKKKEQDITAYFKELTTDNFARTVHDLSQMTTTQIAHTMDTRLMRYIEQQADNFNTIKHHLRTKQKISPQLFAGLLQAFPCVLADVRDFATYVPLKQGLFDVVVIDEASRISIAEAMPALLRAKKVVVLGDKTQAGSPKLLHVNTVLNTMYRNKITASLAASLQDLPADTKNAHIDKARASFDVKKSVFSFCQNIANAELQFTKYFRSPPELIGYVNKKVYGEQLKCLKARALPLNESVKFDVLDEDSVLEPGLHTNLAEARHIVAALSDLKDANFEGTIGIITPYYEQAVLMQKELDECVINDWFEKRQLKVMTFDTAQGETRDYIFYSMVSNEKIERHDYFFPETLEDTEATALQHQRLAVGFSRAQSTVHFVLSKPVKQYWGEVKNALSHFQSKLTSGSTKTSNNSDILMAAESLFPQYFYATKFYKKNVDRTRLVTQFSLGELLKPLSARYRHPAYKVDFLVAHGEQRIIITFDEFKEHFLAAETGNKEAYSNYLTQHDIYNQKVLEGYGYKFLRLNKFNLGAKPIETLDKLLGEAVKKSSWPQDNGFLPND